MILVETEWTAELQKGEVLCLMEPRERGIQYAELGSGQDSDQREYESVVPLAPAIYP